MVLYIQIKINYVTINTHLQLTYELLKMEFTTEEGARTNSKIYVASDGHVFVYHKQTKEDDRVLCRVAGCAAFMALSTLPIRP